MNSTIKYVVLRNYEYLPDKYKSADHGDIDLLVDNFFNATYIANAEKIYQEPFRVHVECKIDGSPVRFDFRYLGDNYYCKNWESDILEKRVLERNCFYVPTESDYQFSLLYHALIQKPMLSNDYKQKLSKYFKVIHIGILENFFDSKGYEFVPPSDMSVFYLFRFRPERRSTIRR